MARPKGFEPLTPGLEGRCFLTVFSTIFAIVALGLGSFALNIGQPMLTIQSNGVTYHYCVTSEESLRTWIDWIQRSTAGQIAA